MMPYKVLNYVFVISNEERDLNEISLVA